MDEFLKILLACAIMLGLALFFGVILTLFNHFFGEKKSEKEEKIISLLGNANCGVCGKVGCEAFAKALINGEAKVADCNLSSEENRKLITRILAGEDVETLCPKEEPSNEVCVCKYQAKCPNHNSEFIPKNAKVYIACVNPDRGKDVSSICKNGCIGCTLCSKKCPHGAIEMVNNLPVINSEKCSGCYECVVVCPVKCIKKIV